MTTDTTPAPLAYEDFIAQARADTTALVRVERQGARAVVTMDDPERLNALSAPLTVQLLDHLRALVADRDIRVIVLTGTDPGFSAGGDLRLMQGFAHPVVDARDEGVPTIWRWIRNEFGGVVKTIVRSETAFVAAVNGPAAGVGLAFALSCDIVLASEQALIVPAFGKIGLLPEVGTSWALTRRLGYQRTFELFAGQRPLTGPEAFEAGIVNACVPHADLLGEAHAWADRLERLPDHVLRQTKQLLRACADMTWDQAITLEEFAEPGAFTTAAHRDGVAALLAR
jgi:2-(1,2-epoxy-1,2-dihydrophenyl)acetyl-CoA isomerase